MKRVLIIAEAGVNHNGNLDLAKQLIEKAHWAGADFVKFQSFVTESLVTKNAPKADYQKKIGDKNDDQYSMLKKLELSFEQQNELNQYAVKVGIKFLSTAFDFESIEFLAELNIPFFKIPSGEINNYPYLKKIAEKKKPVIISTGMANLNEIKDAIALFEAFGIKRKDLIVLHCSTEYPTPNENVNLKAMLTIKDECEVDIGYSDHTQGIEVAIAAVSLGASVIEKHFTLDTSMEGPDHQASLNPLELKQMVDAIRKIEVCLGSSEKKPSEQEAKNKIVARKSIVALGNITEGELLSEKNIGTKRPGDGINPMRWNDVIGTKATKNFIQDEQVIL